MSAAIQPFVYGHIQPAAPKKCWRMASGVNRNFTSTAKLNRAFPHSPTPVVEPILAEAKILLLF